MCYIASITQLENKTTNKNQFSSVAEVGSSKVMLRKFLNLFDFLNFRQHFDFHEFLGSWDQHEQAVVEEMMRHTL